MEKMPPCDIDAERAILSTIMTNSSTLTRVADFLRSDDFYREKHRLIYEAMLTLDAEHTEIDILTIKDVLARRGVLTHFGDRFEYSEEVSQFYDAQQAYSPIETYGEIVQQMRQLRDAIGLAQEIVANAYARDPQTISKAEEALHRISQGRQMTQVVSVSDAVSQYMKKLQMLHERRRNGAVTGVPTGFTSLDHVLGGLQPSDLITLAARPGRGKTSLALNIAQQVAGHSTGEGCNVLIFSLEMNNEQLIRRLISMGSGVDQARLRTGWIEDDEWGPIVDTAATLSAGKMWIDDTAGILLADMRSRARRIQAKYGLDLLIVDYMQLMNVTRGDGKHAENRVQEVSLLSRGLKELARELNVPVLALSQLSRAVEQRQDKVPQLADLRESGSIEQDSDVVMFIYQDENTPRADDGGEIVNLLVAKHRNGPTGMASVRFVPHLTLFQNLEPYDMEVDR